MPATQPAAVASFELIRRAPIDALNLHVEEYRHPETGAIHLHLASESAENVFAVALRTVPEDSTGVAHILEHTVLCGSERYPVRDPFFMMLRRSLNTFMNAFTSSDWTAYPFASQNRKDFSNLLSVYLDAVFFSRLDPLDFAQEGHRVEFEQGDNGESLVYKGVVFNEMKGAMSSISSVLWDRLCFELFPSNTYHFNSGGDPEVIPDLSYQQLKSFYDTHYHPSNAIFMTFGDIPAQEHQAAFESQVLSRFTRSEAVIEVGLETQFDAPRTARHSYALDGSEDTTGKSHHILGWKLGESADLTAMLEAQLLSAVLMENSASPLMKYLETNTLGTSPSPLCGVEESIREMVFCCGIEGSEPERAEEFEQEVLALLEKVAAEGISSERLTAILHQIELHQREITGDGMPYGLNLILRALSAATHRGDAVAALDLDPVLSEIRSRCESPDYIPNLIRQLLLENPHRITLTVVPDTGLSAQRRDREHAKLAQIEQSLSDQERSNVVDLAAKLMERQAQEDDPDILPRVELSDIPSTLPEPASRRSQLGRVDSHAYLTGTNGLVYQQWLRPLPQLNEQQREKLPLVTGLLGEVGIGNADYLAIQDRQSATVGAIGAASLTRGGRDDVQACQGFFLLSSKALANHADEQIALMRDTLEGARFDERARIKELISQIRARRDQSITGNGHSLAMTAATAGMSPLAKASHEQGGLEGIRRLRLWDDANRDDSALDALLVQLQEIKSAVCQSAAWQLAVIADAEPLDRVERAAADALNSVAQAGIETLWAPEAIRTGVQEYWVANTQVNFCARAFPTVPSGHPDAPLLSVLAAVLRNGYLHRAIREQGGAYGGGASHDANIGAFRFFSYRDPRLGGTLDDFEAAVRWFVENTHEHRVVEEAILGVIGAMDKPGSPAGEAKKHFHEALFERTRDQREAFRAAVVAATLEDLQRVAQTYLLQGNASTAVITSAETAAKESALLTELGLQRRELL